MKSPATSSLSKTPILAALLISAAFTPPAATAEVSAPVSCTAAGMNWNADPVFRSALHPSQREHGIRSVACKVEMIRELETDGIRLRLTLGELYYERVDGPRLSVKLVDVAQVEPGIARNVARVFLGPDPLDGSMNFAPQIRGSEGDVYLRLSPRHRTLFRLREGTMTALHAFEWRTAIDHAFPQDGRSGEALSVDLDRMEGRIAIRSIAKDPGQALASAYAGNPILVAKLALRDGRLVTEATEIMHREAGEEPFLDLVNEMDETIRAARRISPKARSPVRLKPGPTTPIRQD